MAYPSSIGEGVGIYAYDGVTLRRIRTPVIFKSVSTVASGNTTIWTPAAGKKFRLIKYHIEIIGNTIRLEAGITSLRFQDNITDISGLIHNFYIPSISSNILGGYNTGQFDLGIGILSAAANNPLTVFINAEVLGGGFRISVCGTEE